MATRFYLPSVGAPRPGTGTAADAGWTTATQPPAVVRRMMRAKENTPFVTVTQTKTAATNPSNLFIASFRSEQLQAQTISNAGTFKGILQAFFSVATTCDAQLIAKVVAADGTTSRGTLIALQAAALSNDWNTTQRNVRFPLNWGGAGAALTQVVAQNYDSILIEIGGRAFTAATGGIASIRIGDPNGSVDLAENETDVADGHGWFEFSQDLLFWDNAACQKDVVGRGQVNRGNDIVTGVGQESDGPASAVQVANPALPRPQGRFMKKARDSGSPSVHYVTWRAHNQDDPYPFAPPFGGPLVDEVYWEIE